MMHLRISSTAKKLLPKCYEHQLSKTWLSGVVIKKDFSVGKCLSKTEESSKELVSDYTDTNNTKVISSFGRFSHVPKLSTVHKKDFLEEGNANTKYLAFLEQNRSLEDLVKFVEQTEIKDRNLAMAVISNLCQISNFRTFNKYISNIQNSDAVKSIKSSKAFLNGFEIIENKLIFLKEKHLMEVFKVCVILNISESSSLMQKLTKILISKINWMSSMNVLLMHCIIENFLNKSSTHIKTLRLACSEFMNNCFIDNFYPQTSVTTMSRYLGTPCVPLKVKEFLLESIMKTNLEELPLWSYNQVLLALQLNEIFSNKPSNVVLLDVERVIGALLNVLEKPYSVSALGNTIRIYANGILKNKFPYYEDVADILALKLVNTNPGIEHAANAVLNLYKMNHFNYKLFEYLMLEVLEKGPEECKNFKELTIVNVVRALAVCGKGQLKGNLDFLVEAITSYPLCEKLEDPDYKIPLTLNLASLGIYNDFLIEKCFTSDGGRELEGEDVFKLSYFSKYCLVLLRQAVLTFHSSYQKALNLEAVFRKFRESDFYVSPLHTIWKDVVEFYFGGSKFVLTNCTTPLHHYINYVVVLDQNNVPVDLSCVQRRHLNGPCSISDIPRENGMKVIAILDVCNNNHTYYENIYAFKGKFQLHLDVLQTFFTDVIPLFEFEFDSKIVSKRLPVLCKKFEKACGALGKRMHDKS